MFDTAAAARRAERRGLTVEERKDVPLLPRTKMAKALMGIEGLVRGPRSFDGDRERQVLRWVSTCMLRMFPGGIEIQCYFDAGSGTVYISANTAAAIGSLQAAYDAHSGDMIAAIRAGLDAALTLTSRESRHFDKLDDRAEGSPYPEQDAVFAALRSGNVVVVDDGAEGLHAERRIGQRFGTLDPHMLAGVKRPCMHCAVALGLLGQSYPGPAWLSMAATMGLTPLAFATALADHVEGCDDLTEALSHVTLSGTTLTTAYDSDSDSELEDEDALPDSDDEDGATATHTAKHQKLTKDQTPHTPPDGASSSSDTSDDGSSSSDDGEYEAARERAYLEVLAAEIRAENALYINNCLINAIADAAGRNRPSEAELITIRGELNNVGEMMIADPRTIDVIRNVLGIHLPVVVYNQGELCPEEFPGIGNEISVTNNGRQHFVPGAPWDMD
jgi:hypothetical protein